MMFMGIIIAIMTQMNWIANFHVAPSQEKMTVDSAGIDLNCAIVLCNNAHSLFIYHLLEKIYTTITTFAYLEYATPTVSTNDDSF